MWEITVIKIGVGVVNSYGFKNRADALAKRAELETQFPPFPEYNITLDWWN
jgi:hypothetical protein